MEMRKLMLGVAACLALCAATAGAADAKPFATVQKFIDSFNKGDAAAAAATHSASAELSITDEVAPYQWNGAQAFQTWAAALEADSKKNGITDEKVTISPPTRVLVSGDQAYLVVPAAYSFKKKGAPMSEKAQMTVVLKKEAGGWLIHGWTWTGPNPKLVPGAK
jgi:ketosteroid isomerase-like protein